MTVLDPDDNWASKVFSEQELQKLRKQLQAVEEDHASSQEEEYVSIETVFNRLYTHEILAWLRKEHYDMTPPSCASEGILGDFLWALGCNICFCYLTDTEWEYNEELSDHATYFGARMFLDDEEDDDLDDDDVDTDDDDT